MRIFLKDLSKEKQVEIKVVLESIGIDVNQVVLYRDGERIIAEVIGTGDRYTLLLDK